MSLKNFLLVLHIGGAIITFGPTFAYPFIGKMASQPGAPVPWLLKLIHTLEWRLVNPLALTNQPATGAAMIVISRDPRLAPFERQGRWLLAGIILYIAANYFAIFVQGRWLNRSIALADAGQFNEEFMGLIQKQQRGGQFLTVLVITIIVLMVVKPGSGFFHQ